MAKNISSKSQLVYNLYNAWIFLKVDNLFLVNAL